MSEGSFNFFEVETKDWKNLIVINFHLLFFVSPLTTFILYFSVNCKSFRFLTTSKINVVPSKNNFLSWIQSKVELIFLHGWRSVGISDLIFFKSKIIDNDVAKTKNSYSWFLVFFFTYYIWAYFNIFCQDSAFYILIFLTH